MSSKRIPSWYRLYLERRLKKIELVLFWLDKANDMIDQGYPYLAKINFNIAKTILT